MPSTIFSKEDILKKLITLTFAFFFSFSAFAGLAAFDNSKKALDLVIEQFTETNSTEMLEQYRAIKIWHYAKTVNVRIYLRNAKPVLYKCLELEAGLTCNLVK